MGNSIIDKPTVTTASAGDGIMLKIGGLLKWITFTNAATVLSGLISAAAKQNIRTVTTTSYTASASDRIINCDASSNAVNINMPPSSELYDSAAGTTVVMKINRIAGSSNNITITPNGSETIDGASVKTIASGGREVHSDGSNLFTM